MTQHILSIDVSFAGACACHLHSARRRHPHTHCTCAVLWCCCLHAQAKKPKPFGTVYYVSGEQYKGEWQGIKRHGELKHVVGDLCSVCVCGGGGGGGSKFLLQWLQKGVGNSMRYTTEGHRTASKNKRQQLLR